jgi:hypothetical protein
VSYALSELDVTSQLPAYLPDQSLPDEQNIESQKQALAKFLAGNSSIKDADQLSEAALSQAVHDSFIGRIYTAEKRQALLGKHLKAFFSTGDGDHAAAAMTLLIAAAWDAGLCQGDPLSKEGAKCAFGYGSPGTDLVGEVADGVNGAKRAIPLLSDDSPIARLITSSCQQANLTSDSSQGVSAESSTAPPPAFCLGKQKGYWWYYQYSCDWLDGCRASGEVFGAITGEYLVSAADTLAAVIPVALRCNTGCVIKSGIEYIFSNDQSFVELVLKNADKRTRRVHEGGELKHYEATSCGVMPAPYTGRPTYDYLKKTQYRLPFDKGVVFKLGTYYQRPPFKTYVNGSYYDLTTPQSQNMYPAPTYAFTTNQASPRMQAYKHWWYNFTDVQGWMFNLVYSATDDYDNLNTCAIYIPLYSYPTAPQVYGKEIWTWHGVGHNESDYGLPTFWWGVGFKAGHEPKLCPLQ